MSPDSLDASPDAGGSADQDFEQIMEDSVKKQLKYLNNPYTIQNYILDPLLKKDRIDEAIVLTRKASRLHKVSVSWNHLINYQMEHQRLHAAVKLYNEVKHAHTSFNGAKMLTALQITDEEARTAPKRPDLYHPLPWMRGIQAPEAGYF
jgi:hypothetical protein